ncbi:MAG: zf-HC2 domain-containing protein [Candidatus Aminicenantes bacterium]|nr:zf-HC2 domain-containing protein [Candidatus Aminicenantes bacterium]
MNCKKAEKWVLRSLDGRLDGRSGGLLRKHLEACPSCRKAEAEYRSMLALLRDGGEAAPLPRFWERLAPRLREEMEIAPLVFWERWCLRAIPVFLVLVVIAAVALFFTPQAAELSQSEALLLENVDPLSGTGQIFSADKADTRNMMLLFASLEEKTPVRRPMP